MKHLSVKINRVLITIACSLFLASAVTAGPIIVSGDGNISPNTHAGNATFFQNILGGGNNVAIQNSSLIPGFGNDYHNYYNSLSGVSSQLFTGTVSGSQLSGVDLLISVVPDDNFTGIEASLISSFLDGGGTLFLVGENGHPLFDIARDAINNLLAQLGSAMSIGTTTVPTTTAVISSDPLTAGVSSFSFVASSGVDITGGTALISNTYGDVIIAYDNLGSVPEPATLVLLVTGVLTLGRRRRIH